jgi:hypothetical protein
LVKCLFITCCSVNCPAQAKALSKARGIRKKFEEVGVLELTAAQVERSRVNGKC